MATNKQNGLRKLSSLSFKFSIVFIFYSLFQTIKKWELKIFSQTNLNGHPSPACDINKPLHNVQLSSSLWIEHTKLVLIKQSITSKSPLNKWLKHNSQLSIFNKSWSYLPQSSSSKPYSTNSWSVLWVLPLNSLQCPTKYQIGPTI